jgi:hypothetical protein
MQDKAAVVADAQASGAAAAADDATMEDKTPDGGANADAVMQDKPSAVVDDSVVPIAE